MAPVGPRRHETKRRTKHSEHLASYEQNIRKIQLLHLPGIFMYNQQDATLHIYLFLWNTIHVSGGSSTHHQELKTVYTALGTLWNLYCYLPLSWKRWNAVPKYPMLHIQFWAPDDGRRNRLKHVEHFTEINKLCNVASRWLYLKIK
jgi:hypothetical protein